MGEITGIEWCDHTINFFMGCHKVSPGCANCYAERDMKRFGKNFNEVKQTNWDNIVKNLKKWSPGRIFTNSFSDLFEESISFEEVDAISAIMAKFPQHQFLVLTKRPHRMYEYLGSHDQFSKNVWLGTSIEDKKRLDRLKWLRGCKGNNIKFVSFEPLLEKVDEGLSLMGIDWVIIGGESGPQDKIRVMKYDWVIGLIEAAYATNTKVFFKQWGGNSRCSCHGAWGCRVDFADLMEFPEVR